MQVVFVGDFFQLPPVNKENINQMAFAFESPIWKAVVQRTIELKTIMRQENQAFQKILNEARIGKLSEESVQVLLSRKGLKWQGLSIKPTLLFTRRADVDYINKQNIDAIKSEPYTYKAKNIYSPTQITEGLRDETPEVKRAVEKMDKYGAYTPELVLKIGAQVMLLNNLSHEKGLINGSRGVVVHFEKKDGEDIPIVQFRNGGQVRIERTTWSSEDLDGLKRSQIPLRLAYAVTIHKAQGATLDCALIDISANTFEYGQAYVALSRVKDLESLFIWDIDPAEFRAHPKVLNFYESLS